MRKRVRERGRETFLPQLSPRVAAVPGPGPEPGARSLLPRGCRMPKPCAICCCVPRHDSQELRHERSNPHKLAPIWDADLNKQHLHPLCHSALCQLFEYPLICMDFNVLCISKLSFNFTVQKPVKVQIKRKYKKRRKRSRVFWLPGIPLIIVGRSYNYILDIGVCIWNI